MWKNIHSIVIVLSSVFMLSFTSIFKANHEIDLAPKTMSYEPVVVLELFTSQGCSSCPSADRLLKRAKDENQKEVYALSYHVDYWNYIGWKDPFSKSEYARKQREYNIKFLNNSNYTPQMVVNGKEHFVGSNSTKLDASIDIYRQIKSSNQIVLQKTTLLEDEISFDYTIQGRVKNKKLRALLVINERSTKVKRGENSNRTLINSNIVIQEKSIDIEASSGSSILRVPKIVKSSDTIALILLVENLNYDITAAAKQTLIK